MPSVAALPAGASLFLQCGAPEGGSAGFAKSLLETLNTMGKPCHVDSRTGSLVAGGGSSRAAAMALTAVTGGLGY